MSVGYINHEEAVIKSFMRDPDFAEAYYQEVLADGDAQEIEKTRRRINEANARRKAIGYWGNIVKHAEETAEDGKNLDIIIGLVSHALNILKSAAHS